MARKQKRKRQPPVSLSPLEPEEALAGLLQVKPEREAQMAEFETGDRVVVLEAATNAPDHTRGQRGVVIGGPRPVERFVGKIIGGPVLGNADIWYQIEFDHIKRTEWIAEGELRAD